MMKDRYVEALGRQVNGLITMNSILKDRVGALEDRCARLEQAMLEQAEALRALTPAGTGSLPSPPEPALESVP